MALSVLYVHAHPDDEAIWTGGTLARTAVVTW
jgi:LmbE family N-acetylglucosaminyl deacetylase